jgi:dihydrofolate synthase/folylpolyglutamate synthase
VDAPGAPGGYAALVARLMAARAAGVRLELDRVRAALARLGHPERRLGAIVQIGGTNGKGSTAAFLDAIARAAGLRVGLYASPHLQRWAERIRVDGAELAEPALVAAGAAALAADPDAELTFFELTTLIALEGFARAGVEVAILEVGLGGRLDATTAAGAGIAAVTGVALDHQGYLGDTLAAIAAEKAAIFALGQRAVVGAAGEPEAVPWLLDAARRAGVASLAVIDAAAIAAVPPGLGLVGAHQRANAACALALADALGAARGAAIGPAARATGLAATRVPGRLERFVRGGVEVWLDGAHNPQAARVVAGALADLPAPGGPRIVVLGVSADKDVAGVVGPLVAGADGAIATRSRHERALPEGPLAAAAAAAGVPAVEAIADPIVALDRAIARAAPAGRVVVAGSLFLIGEIRAHLRGEPLEAADLTDPLAAPRRT